MSWYTRSDERSDRPRLLRLYSWLDDHTVALTTALLFVGFLLLRLPLRTTYPVNWDAVQFALGVQDFDVVHHRPHPPGYIGYIALAKVVNVVVGDPNATLTLIAAVSGAVVPAVFYLLARRFLSDLSALCATLAFGSSILVSYYSEVALTYVVELALLLPFLLFVHRHLVKPTRHDLLLATAFLATLGSFRQTALVLMLPLWLYMIWRVPWRPRLEAGAFLTAAVLIWLVPLLWLAGGPLTYIQASRDLAVLAGGHTSILSMNPGGMLQNVGFVVAGLVIGVNVGVLVLAAGRHELRTRWSSMALHNRMFFALWLLPALGVYILAHTGQVGYILILLPIPFLALGAALSHAAAFLRQLAPSISLSTASLAVTALFVLTNLVGLIAFPMATNQALAESVEMDLRQFDLPANDRHWDQVTATIRNYPPNGTVVLTTIGGPRVSGSFRQLMYLMPDYYVYGLGHNLENGAFGPLFSAHNGQSNYDVAGMNEQATRLELPPGTRYLVIPDEEIAERIELALEDRPAWIDKRGNLTVAIIEPNTLLAFAIRGEVISLIECQEPGCEPTPPQTR